MIEVDLAVYRTGLNYVDHLYGELVNITGLNAYSDYETYFDGRKSITLSTYPRWAESVRGLVARALAIGHPSEDGLRCASLGLSAMEIQIGIRPGGRGHLAPISMVQMSTKRGNFHVGWVEGQVTGCNPLVRKEARYADVWHVAQHALAVSMYGSSCIPEVVPLSVKFYRYGDIPYMRTSDLPEPVRTEFERRQCHSGRPVVPGAADACFAWDWTDFLSGRR
jgi:hypothetical protein